MFFLAVWMKDIVEDINLFSLLNCNSRSSYQRFIRVAKFRFRLPVSSTLIGKLMRGRRDLGLGHSTSHASIMEFFASSRTEE